MFVEATTVGSTLGQEVFIVGYPVGLRGEWSNSGLAMPFVIRGALSQFDPGEASKFFYVSSVAAPGYSGGGIYFPDLQGTEAKLMGIVVESLGYQAEVKGAGGQQVGTLTVDSGIVRCASIDAIRPLIEANPVGFPLDEKDH
jgi:hypothetical protein